ncbi:50S ribosomal protein L19 [Patescibacteria group bacterium]
MARGIINETNIKISPVNVEHRKNLDIRAGDTVRVSVKVVEKGKTRLQAFEGIVLSRKHGSEPGATFTVRKTASGVGVERIFPLYSPNIEKIELVKRSKVRRSKLYYIREKAAKEIRKKMKALHIELPDFAEKVEEVKEEAPAEAEVVAETVETTEDVKEEAVVEEKVKEEEKPAEEAEEVKEEEAEKKE